VRGDVGIPDVGYGQHRTFRSENHPALVWQRCGQPVAQHLHGDESIRPDAPHHAAEFVHVGVQHDVRTGSSLLRDHRPEAIVRNLVGEGLHLFGHDFAYRFFEARRPRRFSQQLEQLHYPILGWLLLRIALRERAARMDYEQQEQENDSDSSHR
jgi:hypothetical protein